MELRPRPARWLGALVLVAAVAVSYQPALDAGFVWDDDSNVTANATLRDLPGLWRIWTDPTANQQNYPLTYTSFWVEYHLWGLEAAGYHRVNVALHAASALLVWRLLFCLGVPGAWLAAAIFAVHPVQVESVAWITERKNTLSGFFFLGAALAGIRFAGLAQGAHQEGGAAASDSRRWRWYVLCWALYLCAVLAKTVTCLLPVALALLIWWKRGRLAPRDLLPLAPLALVGAAAGLRTAWLEQHHVGAVGAAFSQTPAEKLLIAGRAAWFYLGKLLFPADLCFIYPRWTIDSGDAAAWLFPAAALAALAGLWALRGRIGRGPLAAALYYGALLFPALGFFNLYFMRYSYVQDHFQYLASLGPFALFGAGLAQACAAAVKRGAGGPGGRSGSVPAAAWCTVVALAVLVPLATLARQRSAVFRDEETLWRDTLARNPVAWIAHNNLGIYYRARGRMVEAEAGFREAMRLRPDLAETWVNLGEVKLADGRVQEAIGDLRRAVELAPELPAAHVALGVALERAGQAHEAEEHFKEGLRLNPSHAEARTLYGDVLAARGRALEAESQYREAIRLRPDIPQAHLGLGALLAARGDLVEAAASFSRAATLKPDFAEAHYNLGRILDLQGKTAEAVREYRLAIGVKPGFAEAHNNLGVDLLLLGQIAEGEAHLQEALRLKPDYREARVNLELRRGRR